MKSVKLKGRKIVASCRYCGSDDVQLDRSPVWQNGEWMIPNIVTYSNSILQYDGNNSVKTRYGRASCLACKGDTSIDFKLLTEATPSRENRFTYHVEVMERISNDKDDGYDCVFFKREFDSMREVEQSLGDQMVNRHCEVKIKKVIKEDYLL